MHDTRICTIVLSVALSGPLSAADPTTEVLIQQLGSKSFAERERATKSLRDRGPVVLTALRKALDSKDEEVRKRVEGLIPPLEIEEALLPKLISVSVKDQPQSVILNQLEQQTGGKFGYFGEGDGGKRSVEFTDVPYWEALDRLSTKTERIVSNGQNDHIQRARKPSPYILTSGPFRIEAGWIHEDRDVDLTSTERHHRLTMSLCVLAEPRITFMQILPAKIDEAIDSDGKSLLEPKKPSLQTKPEGAQQLLLWERGTFRGESLSFSDVRLQRASESAKSIKLVRGSIPIRAIVIRKPVVVTSKLSESAGTTIRAGADTLTIARAEIEPKSGDVTIEIRIPQHDNANNYQWDQRFKVHDTAGNAFEPSGSGGSSGGGENRVRLYFSRPFNKNLGPATKLIFEDWIIHSHSIPFEFKDLPLP